jgi:hypothetical protein
MTSATSGSLSHSESDIPLNGPVGTANRGWYLVQTDTTLVELANLHSSRTFCRTVLQQHSMKDFLSKQIFHFRRTAGLSRSRGIVWSP